MVFLHGELDIWIIEAESLPNMYLALERVRKCMFGAWESPLDIISKNSGRHSMSTSDPPMSLFA